jgi:hypothetical protein
MPQQQSLTNSSPATKQKLNLLALVFFFLGALHIYQKLQMRSYWFEEIGDFVLEKLMEASLWVVALAGIAEIWSLVPSGLSIFN